MYRDTKMMPFYGLYPPRNSTISERISMACLEVDSLLNKLEPVMVIEQHLPSLKQSLFHSHTKVVQVAVKQLIRIGREKKLAEQLSDDLEVILGLIENLAHKEQRVAKDCVTMLLLLTSTPKSLMNLLCPDITNVLKTIMTYVAVRLLVYEFILQLSINSPLGLEKAHTCGILEDVINDFKKKESYLTVIHNHQLHTLAASPHGRNYLVKYEAPECLLKQLTDVSRECMSHLITVVPTDLHPTVSSPSTSVGSETFDGDEIKQPKDSCRHKHSQLSKTQRSKSYPSLFPQSLATTSSPLEQAINSSSDRELAEHSSSHNDKYSSSLREVHFSSSSSSLSSPCDSLDSSIIGRKPDDVKEFVSDSSSQADRSFTPPLHSPTPTSDSAQEVAAPGLKRLVSTMVSIAPHELLSTNSDTLDIVLKALQSSDKHTVLLALQVLGYVGSTIEGKRQLYKQSKKDKFMSLVMRKLLNAITHSSTEHRAQAVNVFYDLINVSESNSKYEKITRKWFRLMGRPQEIMKLLMVLCQGPAENVQVPTYRLLESLSQQQWGQHYIRGRRGLVEMLLTVSHNESHLIRQLKNSVLETLLKSPSASKTFKSQTLSRIREYLCKLKEISH